MALHFHGLLQKPAHTAARSNLCWAKAPPSVMPTRFGSTRSGNSSSSACAMPADRAAHNQIQAELFSQRETVKKLLEPLPADIEQRLERIVACVPDLGPSSRVVDIGTGTGCLVPHLQARGVKDILAVDLSAAMLAEVEARYEQVGTLGNDIGVRTWLGDVVDLPPYLTAGTEAMFMNSCFGNMHSQRETLLRASLMLKPGGRIVISHPMGKPWHCELKAKRPDMVAHVLPGRSELEALTWDLPLQIEEFVDEHDLYLALLQVPPRFTFPSAPLLLEGPVVRGFGRGSRQMGVPTANIDPAALGASLEGLPLGVYLGWACLDAPSSCPDADRAVHKAVLNIGRRPTVNEGNEALTIEAHILHTFARPAEATTPSVPGQASTAPPAVSAPGTASSTFSEFYGSRLRVLLLGYLRPEMRFAGGLPELVTRIGIDIATARVQLDDPELAARKADPALTGPWRH